jgi:hypothetical protein
VGNKFPKNVDVSIKKEVNVLLSEYEEEYKSPLSYISSSK